MLAFVKALFHADFHVILKCSIAETIFMAIRANVTMYT